MTFHLPSFLLGCVTGVGLKTIAPRLRPVATELATAGFRFVDLLVTKAARSRETLEDLLAEARARARQTPPPPSPN